MLAVMAIITAMAVPGDQVLVHRAWASHARTFVPAIAHAELRHFRARGPSSPVRLSARCLRVQAEGDLDRDGIPSRYTMSGRDLNLQITGELE